MNASLPWYMDESRFEGKLRSIPDETVRAHARFFVENGYVVIRESISQATCDEVLDSFRRVEAKHRKMFDSQKDGHGHYPRIVNLHLSLPVLTRLFHENHQALAVQDAMFESETSLYTSLFYERGSAQSIHRDTPYFCTQPRYRYFGMWVALEDVDLDNGPLEVIPRGHLLKELDVEAIALQHFERLDQVPNDSSKLWDHYQNGVVEQSRAQGLQALKVPVKRGDTILWHPQLPHGGAEIRDIRRTRFSLVMHTTPVGVPVYPHKVFFNPQMQVSDKAGWEYQACGTRRFARHSQVSFAHRVDLNPDQLSL